MKSIIEQLKDNGFDTESLFMPEEFDKAFVGVDMSYTSNHTPVYNTDLFEGKVFPETPEGKREPIFMTKITKDEFESLMPGLYEDEKFFDAAIGLKNDGKTVMYDYDDFVSCWADKFEEDDLNAKEGDTVLVERQRDDEDNIEYECRVESEYWVIAQEYVDFNVIRDYVDKSKILVANINYLLE